MIHSLRSSRNKLLGRRSRADKPPGDITARAIDIYAQVGGYSIALLTCGLLVVWSWIRALVRTRVSLVSRASRRCDPRHPLRRGLALRQSTSVRVADCTDYSIKYISREAYSGVKKYKVASDSGIEKALEKYSKCQQQQLFRLLEKYLNS